MWTSINPGRIVSPPRSRVSASPVAPLSPILEMSPSSTRMVPCSMVLSGKTTDALRSSSFPGARFMLVLVYAKLHRLMRTAPLLFSVVLCVQLGALPGRAQSTACMPAQQQLKAAELASMRDDWLTASELYKDALQIAPACVEALVNLGVVYNRLERPADAIAAFQQALAKNPQLLAAHLNLGITY